MIVFIPRGFFCFFLMLAIYKLDTVGFHQSLMRFASCVSRATGDIFIILVWWTHGFFWGVHFRSMIEKLNVNKFRVRKVSFLSVCIAEFVACDCGAAESFPVVCHSLRLCGARRPQFCTVEKTRTFSNLPRPSSSWGQSWDLNPVSLPRVCALRQAICVRSGADLGSNPGTFAPLGLPFPHFRIERNIS